MGVQNKGLVVITGASSGIGAATAKLFSQKGYPLLLVGRRLDRMKALELPHTLCEQVDIIDASAFKSAIDRAEKEFGQTDCLINNAGVMLLGQLDSQKPEEWKKMYDVNVLALLNGIQMVLPNMKKRAGGTIINVSSIAGRKTFSNHAAYCGTKFAVHAISENLREEVAECGVRVVTIAPGVVETELLSHTSSENIKSDYAKSRDAMGGGLRSEDIANAILYAHEQPQNVCVRELVIAPTRQKR